MLGAIIGDVVGSRYEFRNHRSKDFELFHRVCCFTDDTVCTLAVAKTLMDHYPIDYSKEGLDIIKNDLVANLIRFVDNYPNAGYGGRFYDWATSHGKDIDAWRDNPDNFAPYNSWGNGSAMRISPVGWLANSKEEVMKLTKAVSEVTHNHPEGIKGAQAVAMCIYMARKGNSKEEIKEYVYDHFYPILDYLDYDELVRNYKFDVSCQGSVPQAIYCFLISESYEDTLRTAVSIGGDADTICCMAGSIAEAYYQDTNTEKVFRQFLSMKYLPDIQKDRIQIFYDVIGNNILRNNRIKKEIIDEIKDYKVFLKGAPKSFDISSYIYKSIIREFDLEDKSNDFKRAIKLIIDKNL